MKVLLGEALVFLSLLLRIQSTSDATFEEDFVHSFLIKQDKLAMSERLKAAGEGWLEKTAYKDAVAVMLENWTNQKLEFPEMTQDLGGVDRWYPPQDVPKHTRDIVAVAYSSVTSVGNKGTVSYLLEDSWPRLRVVLGWCWQAEDAVEVVLSLADTHLSYADTVDKELNGLVMKDKMRFYKGTAHYVVAVTCHKVGSSLQLVVSVIPQNLDVWAWEKYYKQQDTPGTSTRRGVELRTVTPQTPAPSSSSSSNSKVSEEEDQDPGIFSRKELLTPGESVLDHVGNLTERAVLARLATSLCVGVRVENWSRHTLARPQLVPAWGKQSPRLPVTEVRPGHLEFAVLQQDQGATGVSAVIRWHIGDTDTVLSLMVSVPYSLHLWSSWAAVGLTKDAALPDFSAMYSGTPDSDWFVRQEMGHRMEFTDGELVLVVESDGGTSKPVIRLSVVPLSPDQIAKSIQYRLQGKPVPTSPVRRGREGDKSVLALSSSSASASSQCYCPCMATSPSHCLARLLLLATFIMHATNIKLILAW